MSKIQQGLTIGVLAKAAEINVESVRYYQSKGLIRQPDKPLHGYRQYPAATVNRIRFIKRAQRLGFSLLEIADLLDLGSGRCHDVKIKAERKRDLIESQIQDLQILSDSLKQMIDECNADKNTQHCPIVESLFS